MPAQERKRTAYHESGHALLGMLEPGADPVRKISIIPRGRALGVTLSTPDTDRYGYDEDYLRGRIVGALGAWQPKNWSSVSSRRGQKATCRPARTWPA
jgi:cell division protease FtsH